MPRWGDRAVYTRAYTACTQTVYKMSLSFPRFNIYTGGSPSRKIEHTDYFCSGNVDSEILSGKKHLIFYRLFSNTPVETLSMFVSDNLWIILFNLFIFVDWLGKNLGMDVS